MRILSLVAENFAKLKAVAIRPDGHLVQVTGKNRNGKTSVLNAIWVALDGMNAETKRVVVEPIRHGAERARVRLELGEDAPELIVTRIFTDDGEGGYTTSLKVESGAKATFRKPQEVLDALLGALTFDPLKFARADDVTRLKALRPLVPDVDFDALTAANAADFSARTDKNRLAKDRRAQAEGIVLPPGAVPAKVDVAALEEELAGSAQFNADIEQRKANRAEGIRQADAMAAEIERLHAMVADLAEKEAALRQRLAEAPALEAPKDILALRTRLTDARAKNEVAEKAARRGALEFEAEAAETESAALTKAIDKRKTDMAAAVAKAVGKVPGLAHDGERLTLNGAPFDQASDAEQLEASILIAALLNPTLRVIRVRDGSLLDEDALAAVAATAERLDCQVWLERVDSSGAVGFVLEDGELKGPDTAPAPRPVMARDTRDGAVKAAELPSPPDEAI